MNETHGGEVIGSLLDPMVQDDPLDFYRQLHAHAPVYRMPENGYWLVTGFEEVRKVLLDPETFSNAIITNTGLQGERYAAYRAILRERGWEHVATLNRCDPPEHARFRMLVERVFTPARVRALAPGIDAKAHALIDRFIDRGSCDFVREFALPLPGMIIAEQLGLDGEDVHTLKRWGDAFLAIRSRVLSDPELHAAAETELEAQHFLASVFEARRVAPADDLVSALVHAHGQSEQRLTVHELQGLVAQLIAAGFETTMNAISHALWLLIRFPEQDALLRRDRSRLKGFVEEVLRYDSPTQGLLRHVRRDVELGGHTIPRGAVVIVRFGAANHDPARFECPHAFDIARANSLQHVAFGAGIHFCVGAALARQEMTSAFNAVLDRMHDIALSRPMPVPAHEPHLLLRPLKELPIRFTATPDGRSP